MDGVGKWEDGPVELIQQLREQLAEVEKSRNRLQQAVMNGQRLNDALDSNDKLQTQLAAAQAAMDLADKYEVELIDAAMKPLLDALYNASQRLGSCKHWPELIEVKQAIDTELAKVGKV